MELENKNCPLQPKATYPPSQGSPMKRTILSSESFKFEKMKVESDQCKTVSLKLKGNATELHS